MKKALSVLLSILILNAAAPSVKTAAAALPRFYGETELVEIAEGIIGWKKTSLGLSSSQSLLADGLKKFAGTGGADWYAIALKRMDCAEETGDFTAALAEGTAANIANSASPAFKVTDIHRNILALLVFGSDPASFSTPDGTKNLLSDYVYNRGRVSSLGRQGIPGWIWGLITLDSMQYAVPEGSFDTRGGIIAEILKLQRTTGGFSLSGNASDPDTTAMAIHALSPYYNSETNYTYVRTGDSQTLTRTVRQVVDEALACLSSMQLSTGDFSSWGQRCAESPAQVILALCSLGIDPQTDARFIKNGKTLLDGMLLYRMSDGGFSHTLSSASSNSIAGEQVLCALAAMLRQTRGLRRLYDMRPEQSAALKASIRKICGEIASIRAETPKSKLQAILAEYRSIVDNEKMYVYNYSILEDALNQTAPASSATAPAGSSSQDSRDSSRSASEDPDFSGSGSETPTSGETSSSQSRSEESRTGSETSSDSPDSRDSGARTATTAAAIAFILLVLGAAVWMNLRQRHRKQKGKNE